MYRKLWKYSKHDIITVIVFQTFLKDNLDLLRIRQENMMSKNFKQFAQTFHRDRKKLTRIKSLSHRSIIIFALFCVSLPLSDMLLRCKRSVPWDCCVGKAHCASLLDGLYYSWRGTL